tara:strand:+ start:381 stop:908 length:528 start_codon:yes stop_codon:yes gene_type:complete
MRDPLKMMKKQRQKLPTKVGKGSHPQRKPKNNYFSNLMTTPEGRELRKKWSQNKNPNIKRGRPKGVPDGFTNETIIPIREKAKQEAKKVIEIMADQIEDDFSKEALQTAVEIMRMPNDTRSRIASARLVLDFTKSKPVAKSEIAVAKAEEFLASLLDNEEEQNGQEVTESSKETL